MLLIILFVWNMIVLFSKNGGSYGDYPMWSQVIAGWIVSGLVFISGFIARAVINSMKKKGFVEDDVVWDKPIAAVKTSLGKAKKNKKK